MKMQKCLNYQSFHESQVTDDGKMLLETRCSNIQEIEKFMLSQVSCYLDALTTKRSPQPQRSCDNQNIGIQQNN